MEETLGLSLERVEREALVDADGERVSPRQVIRALAYCCPDDMSKELVHAIICCILRHAHAGGGGCMNGAGAIPGACPR